MSSWVEIPEGSGFTLANLPYGVANDRAWVAIGDSAVDLAGLANDGLLDGTGAPAQCFAKPALNEFLAAGPDVWSAVRQRLTERLSDSSAADRVRPHLAPRKSLHMQLPVEVGDYVDCYSSLHHATNLGRLFRPDGDPLLPNWRQLPVSYHGRSGTLVPDGASIPRPSGLRTIDGQVQFGPSVSLDIELEVGHVVGVGNHRGHPIPIGETGQHLFGICLVNDWSARDIQAFEYQPLGPFLGKSFATSVSPWLVTYEALAPFRIAPPAQDPPVADYLTTADPWGLDLHLEVWLQSAAMDAQGIAPVCLSEVGFADMYWTPAQQLAHLTVNGASTRPGDLFASGTVSGAEPGERGSLIELTWRGANPIDLPDGTTRSFLADGDRIELRGWAGSDQATRIGLGSVSGTITTSPMEPAR